MSGPWERPVAVLGAGTMGRGIAAVALGSGAEVRLADVAPAQLEAAVASVRQDLAEGVRHGKVPQALADTAGEHLLTTTDTAVACAGAGLVIETVVEDLAIKQQVVRAAEGATPPDALIASNTSALSVTAIMSVLDDPARALGMHFFNPVPKMRLCELVVALQTDPATLDAAAAAAERLGKTAVRVADVPGFATSRLNALLGNEGFRMLEQGVASPEDIDTAARLGLNHPMGPLEMADLVGLDVRLAVLEHLRDTLGERFRPTAIHRRLVAAGRLGRKTGRGVYRYDPDGNRLDEPSDLGRR